MTPLPDNEELFFGIVYAHDQSFYGVIAGNVATIPVLALVVFLMGFAVGSVV